MSNKLRTPSYGGGKSDRQRDRSRPGPYPRVDVIGSRPGGNKSPPYNRVFVSNISYEEKWQNLKDVFRNEVGEVTYAEIITDDNGTSKGFGIVEFKTKEMAAQAVEKMNGYTVKDRKLVVKEDFYGDFLAKALRRNGMSMPGNIKNAEQNQPWFGMPPPMSMAGMPPPMPGHGPPPSSMHHDRPAQSKSPDISHKINEITGGAPVGDTIFIANLDYSVSYPKLKEVFSLAGNVLKVVIHLDHDNKSKGQATVTYETPLEALQAISMFNQQLLFDRPMVVKMDRNAGQPEKQTLPSGLQGIGPSLNLSKLSGGDNQDVFSAQRPDTSVRNDMSNELEMITARKKLLENQLGMNRGSLGGISGPQYESGIPGLLKQSAPSNSLGLNLGSLGQQHTSSQSTLSNLGLMQATALGALTGNGHGRGNLGPSMQNYRGAASDHAIPGLLSDRERLDIDIARVDSRIRDLDRSMKSAEQRLSTTATSRSSVPSSPGTVFVANLPYTLSRQELKQRFSVVGNATYVNIRTGDNGRSKGFGHVQFESLEEAMMAVRHFNGTIIDGRRIEVKLDDGRKAGRR